MNLSKPKVLLVLGVAAAIFWFVSDDKPPVTEQTKVLQPDSKPVLKPQREMERFGPRSDQYSQAPFYPPASFERYGQPPVMDSRWASQYPESRFRPLDQNRKQAEVTRPDSRQFQSTTPNFSYAPSGQEFPQYRYNDGRTQADSMSGRFRPWDEKRQSRRWQGNFQRMTYWPEQLAAPERYSPLWLARAD